MTTQGLHVLVVDDNAMNRKMLSMVLKTMGITTEEADGGVACLELVSREKYDVIFMDHLMPEMDGVETFHRLKELTNSLNSDTPVIALTADDLGSGESFFMEAGFNGYLVKPVLPKNLEELIASL